MIPLLDYYNPQYIKDSILSCMIPLIINHPGFSNPCSFHNFIWQIKNRLPGTLWLFNIAMKNDP